MAESLTKHTDETIWYENEERIKEFLESFRKVDISETDDHTEELSWFEIVERSHWM